MLFAFKTLSVVFCLSKYVEGFNYQQLNARIARSNAANITEYPFYAALSDCGGAILTDRWVVTAAQCVSQKSYWSGKSIWVGGNKHTNSKRVVYDKVVVHPDAHLDPGFIPRNDIALLHLREPLQFTDKIRPIDLPNDKVLKDPKLVLLARGQDKSGDLSTMLKEMDVQGLTSEECLSQLPHDIQNEVKPALSILEKIIICGMRVQGQHGLCHGDRGSPLTQGDTLIGIVSFVDIPYYSYSNAMGCSKSRLGFYVRVAEYVPWINSVISS